MDADLSKLMTALNASDQSMGQQVASPPPENATPIQARDNEIQNNIRGTMVSTPPGNSIHPQMWNLVKELLFGATRSATGAQQPADSLGAMIEKGGK